MNVLLLGPERPQLIEAMREAGDRVVVSTERLTVDSECVADADFLVSYGYRYIITPDVLALFERRAINLHIAYLPWNRGADPNLWSFLDDTPKGVTIHFLDEGVDTGAIIAQEEVTFDAGATLRSSYDILSATIERLFIRRWPSVRLGEIEGTQQPSGGSLHRIRDRQKVEHLLHSGWDTPVADLVGRARETLA
jgi:methionyl-tRNA formyltransferase